MADRILDTTGLTCPLPILKAKKLMRELGPGATLEVLASDPGAVEDFQVFAEVTGHALLEQGEKEGVYRFVLRKSG